MKILTNPVPIDGLRLLLLANTLELLRRADEAATARALADVYERSNPFLSDPPAGDMTVFGENI